ncbi:MAG: S8 family serine peptidase [Phormidium sp. BM_Day4_Bin.17]|nr:S8 family serine peptidase [Phormidium sp. BM_Day4_Bin.17]UCJ10650.1 MAG: S8 family serine peptidase [Phormidium sp. PBR-2020]
MTQSLPSKLYAEAIVRSPARTSLLSETTPLTPEAITQFYGDRRTLDCACDRLAAAGFEVLQVGNLSISIAAPADTYERVFQTTLRHVERPVIKERARETTATFIDAADSQQFGKIDTENSSLAEFLDGVAINEPVYYLGYPSPSPTPPSVRQTYLQVPDGLAQALNAQSLHEQGICGQGTHVVMVDTGWYRHPYFAQHNYHVDVKLAPGSDSPDWDHHGHGTGESANLLAIAPQTQLTVVKADVALKGKFRNVNSIAAFRTAAHLRPDIISCSWGTDIRYPPISAYNRLLAATVVDAIHEGIIVVFAAGNGHWGFPAQHPNVLSVGGVYLHLDGPLKGQLEASNYASAFNSPLYPKRGVPDVCGLVGQRPDASYIMLPVPPGSRIDKNRALAGDETESNDGWAAFSGTSAAAPQIAGICALIRQMAPRLSPFQVKEILQKTARDVQSGGCHPAAGGYRSQPGFDLATGAGLADAGSAIAFLTQRRFSTHQRGNYDVYQSSIRREPQMSDFPKLRQNLETLIVEFNELLQEKFEAGDIEAVELSLSEGNFVRRSPKTRGILALVKLLKELDDPANLELKHVFAAQSLLKIHQYRELATEVLIEAVTHESKKISEAATQALGELMNLGRVSEDSTNCCQSAPENPSILFDGMSIDLFFETNPGEYRRFGTGKKQRDGSYLVRLT